jgi:integrase
VRKVRHHPALAYANAPMFMAELRTRDSISARALEFLILTAARPGAVTGATWAEIDLNERIWTVPPSRFGSKITADQARRVPCPIVRSSF